MNRITFALSVLASAMPLMVSAVNFPLGTYVYAGTAKNYRNEALTAKDEVRIQAVSEGGVVLADSNVVDPDGEGVNFRLEVPVSSSASDKSAAIGDAPRCVVVSASGVRGAATETFPPILAASAVTNCTVVWSDAVSYTNGADVAVVPSDYIDGITYLMVRAGKGEYDPWADWDGDGASNYAEYCAGTNPFDKSDFLRITGFTSSTREAVLTFEYVGGHLYALKAAKSLVNPEWAATEFRAGGAGRKTLYAAGDDDVGEATLYVTPAAEASQMFFKVEVK